jgi:hypothetical protein
VKINKEKFGIYPTKFARSTQKHEKVIEVPNQPIANKSMFSTLKKQRSQKFVWELPETQNRKKITVTTNY